MEQPKYRSVLRLKLGAKYYGAKRRCMWIKNKKQFAKQKSLVPLKYTYFSHKTPLLRKLKDVDMWMQHNKVNNLKIAVNKVNGIILHPGEVFSYWYLIGKPTKRKGYLPGMILRNGSFYSGTGGGLCQLSNLIFWMTAHTPLTVIERHRHGYDVFPDSNRTQPFGSGATCFYPHGDLMIRNDTEDNYQLIVNVGDEFLEGEWRVDSNPKFKFKIVERNHEFKSEFWGGFTRHNELYKQTFGVNNMLIDERLIVTNDAITMYSPFLKSKN
ncbi:MAG: VanW family protein [Acutalibacteraceae bacterium]|nr:VanW family protein [Acutalibacteraceae bacterium]